MMRALAWLICMAASLAVAQTPARIEGTVVNSVTGAGVRKAQVNANGRSAVTDSTGHFALENVPPGSYEIQVNCPGYAPSAPGGKVVAVADEQQVKDVAIKIMPLSVISGKVRDENGDPMARVQITAWRSSYSFGHRHLAQAGFMMTNDRGQFRLFDLPPGKYYLQANPLLMTTNLGNRVYPTTYYPSGLDVTQAIAQEVKPGEELNGLEFRLKKMATFHVRGTVVGPEGTAQLLVYRAQRTVNVPRTVRADGSFDLTNLVPGEYRLLAFRNDLQPFQSAWTPLIVSDHDVDDLKLALEPVPKLRGTISDASIGRLEAVLQPEDVGFPSPPPTAFATANEDGTFEFQVMLPGFYSFSIRGDFAPRYVKSIELNGQEMAGDIVDLTQHFGGEFHVVFGSDGGTIQGVTSPSTTVTAVPLVSGALRRDQFATTRADRNGSFQFHNLAPGRYQVMAWSTSDLTAMQHPDVRKELSSRAATVTLGPNGNEAVQLTVIPADEIAAAIQKLP